MFENKKKRVKSEIQFYNFGNDKMIIRIEERQASDNTNRLPNSCNLNLVEKCKS